MAAVRGAIFLIISVIGIISCSSLNGRDEKLDTVTATVKQGVLRGRLDRTTRNNEYRYYLGVPFGEAPVGAGRYKAPVAASPWTGEYNALERKPICFQRTGNEYVGSEDCLFLDVHTPEPITGLLRPVFFFIYGGGFAGGSSITVDRPETFIDEGVIVVAPNHRVGPLGFLSLNTSEVPGNAGLKDQVLALKWVRDNIEHLGGDPNNIVVGGQSSGSASASFLQMSKMSRNLFHKNILLGGTPLLPPIIQRNPVENALLLGQTLAFDTSDPQMFLKQLQNAPAADIHRAASGMNPSIETEFEGVEAYLTKDPREYLESGDFAHIPVIMGYGSKEGAGSFNTNNFNVSVYDSSYLVPSAWGLEDEYLLNKAAERIRDFFFGTQVYEPDNREMQMQAIDYRSDIFNTIEIREAAEIITREAPGSVYFFRFSYRGKLNVPAIDLLGVQGAAHGDERRYIFPPIETLQEAYSSDEWVSRRLGKLLSNFIKTGNPTPGPANIWIPVKWLPMTTENVYYLNVDSDLTPSLEPDGWRIKFWKDLKHSLQGLEKSKN